MILNLSHSAPRAISRLACIISAVLALSIFSYRSAGEEPAMNAEPVAPAVIAKPLAPPANDVPGQQPSPQHVWTPGHWQWGQGSYVWVAGRWEIPPASNSVWIAPQWREQGNGVVLREGYWQQSQQATETTSAAQLPPEITTMQSPPPPRPEQIPPQPSPAYIWQQGYWTWQDTQFVWVNGRWELPLRAGVVWVPTHWETRGDRWVLVSGYWRDNSMATTTMAQPSTQVVLTQPAPAAQVVVIPPPPPPQTEVMVVRPSPYHVWVPGYWAWRGGRHVWVAGHWERPPHGHRSWEPARWERRGGNYIFIEGHWR
jgi:hypothetical protein